MRKKEEKKQEGAPEWVVTYGDMMSLLLTFFIMLVSMSEIKEDEKYQAMVDSMRQEFGHEATIMPIPGEHVPRNSNMIHTASAGRARRRDTVRGGAKVKAIVGENRRVHSPRTGKHSFLIGEIRFDADRADLDTEAQAQLQNALAQLVGKPQRIEIRGHTARRPLGPDSALRDKWDLAYERCRRVMGFLIEHGVDQERVHFRVAADNEPVYEGIRPEEQARNDRVQILMWDERVGALE